MALRVATVLCLAVGINAGAALRYSNPASCKSHCLTFVCVPVEAEAVELTEKNFERLVFKSGKAAFIKFQAPW